MATQTQAKAQVAQVQTVRQPIALGDRGVRPRSLEDVFRMAKALAHSAFVPAQYQGRPADVMAAILYGLELGLSPMQALQTVAVVNGKPSVYGDGLLALAMTHPQFGGIHEWLDGKGDDLTAYCKVIRHGVGEIVRSFSVADAKLAGLWTKKGPWRSYPKRMLQMRARSWALRDAFPDALRGVIAYEEAQDIEAQPEVLEVRTQDVAETTQAQNRPAISLTERIRQRRKAMFGDAQDAQDAPQDAQADAQDAQDDAQQDAQDAQPQDAQDAQGGTDADADGKQARLPASEYIRLMKNANGLTELVSVAREAALVYPKGEPEHDMLRAVFEQLRARMAETQETQEVE